MKRIAIVPHSHTQYGADIVDGIIRIGAATSVPFVAGKAK